MASATTVLFSARPEAQFALPELSEASAKQASKILQDNHDKHDIIFTDVGLHNHIVHHICTCFALGASPEVLQQCYDVDGEYQRHPPELDECLLRDIQDPEVFVAKMGTKTQHYSAYLRFFTREIQKNGAQQVILEYVFSSDERANTMFKRLFAGLLHPMIHLGFGIEFDQPAIIAEALGQTCIHPTFLDPLFDETDAYVNMHQPKAKSLVEIIDDIQNDPKLRMAVRWDDGPRKLRDGILGRAGEEMIAHAAAWQVPDDKLEESVAEMINACAYFGGAAQNPSKEINFDFYYMHAITASIFFSVLARAPWLDRKNKCKLIEYKGRIDLCQYASRRAPKLYLNEITEYKSSNDWDALFARARSFGDDGHAAKFIRALANGERVCKPFENSNKFRIKGQMWLQLGNMVMDSVESTNALWIRSAGFEEAWKDSKIRVRN